MSQQSPKDRIPQIIHEKAAQVIRRLMATPPKPLKDHKNKPHRTPPR